MSNLKVDIMYYKTSSDFEMEFNLSGCCRMRIFKEKIDTRKDFVSSLARNVSRSKIIIVATELFGEESIIPTLAKAISLPLTAPDIEEFGIKTTENILLPSSAVPLVTKTGIYGGCIIESGPQSIIIVSNVRLLRHEIMKTYVHNYVFDVGQLLAYQERMGQNSDSLIGSVNSLKNQRTAASEDNSNIAATIPIAENTTDTVILNESCTSSDVSSSQEAIEDTKNEDLVLVSDLSAPNQCSEPCNFLGSDTSKVVPAISESAENNPFDTETLFEEFEPKKTKKNKSNRASSIILLVIVILLLIAFGGLAYYFIYLPIIGVENTFFSGQNEFFAEINKLF